MSTIIRWLARLVGAGMLGATAGIHAYLYHGGYSRVPTIGPMFLALVIGASILCLAVLAGPPKLVGLAALVGALTEAATAVGLLIFTHHTIFNFRESTHAKYYSQSLVVESIGVVVLIGLAAATLRRNPDPTPGSAGRAAGLRSSMVPRSR
jgi:hypothetical protein